MLLELLSNTTLRYDVNKLLLESKIHNREVRNLSGLRKTIYLNHDIVKR